MIILKVTKNQRFTVPLDDLEVLDLEMGQFDPPSCFWVNVS